MKTPEELALRGLGEVMAAQIALRTIIQMLPNRDELESAIRARVESQLVLLEPEPYPEPFIAGMRFFTDQILDTPTDPRDLTVR